MSEVWIFTFRIPQTGAGAELYVIVNARYLLGAATKTDVGLCYVGFDLETETTVKIMESESAGQAGDAQVLDSFQENGEYYCVTAQSDGKTPKKMAELEPIQFGSSKADQPLKSSETGGKKNGRKALVIGIAAVALVIVVGSVTALQISKNNRYQAAMEAYQSGNYADAVSQFEEMSGYKDSESMVEKATQYVHYEAGLQAKQEKRYADAIVEFALAADVPEVNEQLGESYQLLGNEHLSKKAYSDAVKAFTKAKEYGVKDAGVYVTYADGLNDLNKKNYSSAVVKLTKNIATTKDVDAPMKAYSGYVTHLIDRGEYVDAENAAVDYTLFCSENKCDSADAEYLYYGAILSEAESLYDDGYLADAKAEFERAAEGAAYNGIDRDARLEKLAKHQKLLDMEGEWATASGRSSVVSGSWIYYYDLKEENKLPLSIRFVLNDDGTVTASGSCTWLSCANLLTTHQEKLVFVTQVNPNNIQLADVYGVKGKVSLTRSRDAINLRFTSTDGTTVKYVYKKAV